MSTPLPALRPDLEFLPKTRRGKPLGGFLIRDPHTKALFEMEEEEFFLCQQLDGHTPLATIQARYQERFGTPLPLEDLQALLRQLEFQGLLATPVTRGMVHHWDPEEELIPVRRLPIFNPSRLLAWLAARLRWCFTRTAFLCSLAFIAFGLHLLIDNWSRLLDAMYAIWIPSYFPLLVLVGVLCVQVPHELAHGLVATHYGGHVTRAGFMVFYYFIPKFYVDRRQTLALPPQNAAKMGWVLFAGLYCQMLLASLGIMGALLATPGSAAHDFWTALWSTAAWGFVHNSNIAHRRDLHLILAFWLREPELRAKAITLMLNWLLRRPEPEPLTRRARWGYRLFGLLTVGFAVFHWGLMFAAFGEQMTQLFQGAGAVLFTGVMLYIFHRPLTHAMRRPLRWLLGCEARAAVRWLIRLGLLAAFTAILFIPYPYHTGGPFVLLPVKQIEVHAEVEGKIEQVLVKEGDWVTAGQPLVLLDRREIERNLKATQEQLAATEAQLRLLKAGPKPEEVKRAEEQVEQAEQEVRQAEQEVEKARVEAEFSRAKAARYAGLYQRGIVSQQEYENTLLQRDSDAKSLEIALQNLEVKKKNLEVARANLELVKSGARPEQIEAMEAEVRRLQTLVADYQRQLELTVLRSPIDGQVITPYIDRKVGQYIKKGDLVAVVAESRTIQAEVAVPEEEAPEVRHGALVKVVAWAYPHTTFRGQVTAVAPVATENTHSTVVRVLTEIPNPQQLLKADMTGYAKIRTEPKPLWNVLLRRIIRWFKVQFWYWLP
ncbi:MAG: hypothetical protein KatS3mg131_0058 [Candidatus Tectimicrobiota bacterium]|nr:MAG: hypothetical protein KatS3mg131_0058 [Candidatus Tectomicrobia bacterium]